ncbi:MAG: hypothetical protein QXK37_01005 [Candidatus Woesearchaeota archaeon]
MNKDISTGAIISFSVFIAVFCVYLLLYIKTDETDTNPYDRYLTPLENCYAMENLSSKNWCFAKIAWDTGKPEICDRIEIDDAVKNYCWAQATQNKSRCKDVSQKELQEICLREVGG